ncbi:hypothetical protein PVL29_027327 [Vitis rotundifolia]|uniref:Uncharacterized protein n=1 Tax=Vitis rotundifolia TaxID=103349 RepID=A0AA38YIZ3_VITRO|nr:hypothetical protein PVL29_027327 [Vitis rotundifolia]
MVPLQASFGVVWRCPPHSRNHATQSFDRVIGLNSPLGMDKPTSTPLQPPFLPNHSKPNPTWPNDGHTKALPVARPAFQYEFVGKFGP